MVSREIGESVMSDEVVIDARGLLCPLPVLRLRKALRPLPLGTTVTMIATDPAAQIDVPHFCAESGNIMLEMQEIPGGVFEYRIRRGPSAPSVASDLSPEDT